MQDFWDVTITYQDGFVVTGRCGSLYQLGPTVMELTTEYAKGPHGEIVSIHAE